MKITIKLLPQRSFQAVKRVGQSYCKVSALFCAYWHIFFSFAFVLLIFSWFITYGTWQILGKENFGIFFDAQAKSLLKGRLDVPLSAIQAEAFIVNGKYYGYFGLTPALLRIPLVFLQMDGCWSRLSMLIACFLNLLFAYRIYSFLQKNVFHSEKQVFDCKYITASFLLVVGLGTTNIFLASRAYVYHETIIWAGALALISIYFFAQYTIKPTATNLIKILVFALLTVLSRPTIGFGILLGCFILGLSLGGRALGLKFPFLRKRIEQIWGYLEICSPQEPWRIARLLFLGIALILVVFFGLNYLKFGEFSGMPLAKHIQFIDNPERLKKIDGQALHLSNIRTNLYNYFSPVAISFSREFPWVGLTTKAKLFEESRIDWVEPYASIPTAMASLFVLAIAGSVYTFGRRKANTRFLRLVIFSSMSTGILSLTAAAISYRYLHDFFPFWIIGSAIGLFLLSSSANRKLRRFGILIWTLLGIWGIYSNLAFALCYQRDFVWGVDPVRKQAFFELRNAIDNIFTWKPMETIFLPNDKLPQKPMKGQIAIEGKIISWFDGERWVKICESTVGTGLELIREEKKIMKGNKVIRQKILEFSNAFKNFFDWKPMDIIFSKSAQEPKNPLKGQLWVANWQDPSIFWFNGEEWFRICEKPKKRGIKFLIEHKESLSRENPNGIRK